MKIEEARLRLKTQVREVKYDSEKSPEPILFLHQRLVVFIKSIVTLVRAQGINSLNAEQS